MSRNVTEAVEIFKDYLNNMTADILMEQAVVINNGTWNIYIDYQGDEPEKAIIDLRALSVHRPKIIKRIATSKTPGDIIRVSRDLSDYFHHRSFVVSVGTDDGPFLRWWFRFRLWLDETFPFLQV